MALLPVQDALALVIKGVKPLAAESVRLHEARGRVLARDLKSSRDQPPFVASAMDGYAVAAGKGDAFPARLTVIGTSAAGRGFKGAVAAGEAVRIFTGAPLPRGADRVVIQENAARDGDAVIVREGARAGQNIRAKGLDFAKGEIVLRQGQILTPRRLGLAAAMNLPLLPVRRRPRVAILATGDELVEPGRRPDADQIVSSNSYALAAMVATYGGEPVDLGIVGDGLSATRRAIARAAQADVLVTSGGASVGDHDVVQDALRLARVRIGFWKIAMRPGKPLMFGRRGSQRILGLPGNPVSALVCARLFLKPLIDALLGLVPEAPLREARLGAAMAQNDLRQDYVRAKIERREDGVVIATPYPRQDSSMQRLMAEAQALIVRPPLAPAAEEGSPIKFLPLDF